MLKLITRSEGKETLAPESDKREALVVTPQGSSFGNLNEPIPIRAGAWNR
jgi:hypothetical protein